MAWITSNENKPPKETAVRIRMEEYKILHSLKGWGQPMHDVLHRVLAEYLDQKRRIQELEYFLDASKARCEEYRKILEERGIKV